MRIKAIYQLFTFKDWLFGLLWTVTLDLCAFIYLFVDFIKKKVGADLKFNFRLSDVCLVPPIHSLSLWGFYLSAFLDRAGGKG